MVVTSDIVTDQRVLRVATSLSREGYLVSIIARQLPSSQPLPTDYPFAVKRMKLPFTKGPLFYAVFNLFAFFRLVFAKKDVVVANDLDTLPACSLAATLCFKKLLYDSHELFTELPELTNRPLVKSAWATLERVFIKKASAVTTVCRPIAKILADKYGKNTAVIRNVPTTKTHIYNSNFDLYPRILLYQGALNKGRGIETMIRAMAHLDGYELHIAGEGYLEAKLHDIANTEGLAPKVKFLGKINPCELKDITPRAFLGFSLEEPTCLNYQYALPNKLFDYIHARVPVVVSNLPEMTHIVDIYGVGVIIEHRSPLELAKAVTEIANDPSKYQYFRAQCEICAGELCWEHEENLLFETYNSLIL